VPIIYDLQDEWDSRNEFLYLIFGSFKEIDYFRKNAAVSDYYDHIVAFYAIQKRNNQIKKTK
jgi:hypothetical protein